MGCVLRMLCFRHRKLGTLLALTALTLFALSLVRILQLQQVQLSVQPVMASGNPEISTERKMALIMSTTKNKSVFGMSSSELSDQQRSTEISTPQSQLLLETRNTSVTKNSISNQDNSACPLTLCNNGRCFENLVCYKPFKYLENYKNPCFYEQVAEDDSDQSVYKNLIILRMLGNKSNEQSLRFHRQWQERRIDKTQQLRCLPYFFIIGMEKCGTTDLYTRLNTHPDIALSPAKELQWWTRRRFFIKKNDTFPGPLQSDNYKMTHTESLVNVPFSHYYAFFDQVSDSIEESYLRTKQGNYHFKVTGDGSPNTMYWNDFAEIFAPVTKDGPTQLVAHHIAAVLPQAKLICILRDPIDRLYSSYLFFNRGISQNTFHIAVLRAIKKFRRCVEEMSLRFCVYDRKLKEDVGSTINLMQGIYSVMIADWLQLFSSTQLHVMHFESYKKSELEELNKAFHFLELSEIQQGSRAGQIITRRDTSLPGSQYKVVGEMLQKTRTTLQNFYRPYNEQLAEMLNDQRFLWDS